MRIARRTWHPLFHIPFPPSLVANVIFPLIKSLFSYSLYSIYLFYKVTNRKSVGYFYILCVLFLTFLYILPHSFRLLIQNNGYPALQDIRCQHKTSFIPSFCACNRSSRSEPLPPRFLTGSAVNAQAFLNFTSSFPSSPPGSRPPVPDTVSRHIPGRRKA